MLKVKAETATLRQDRDQVQSSGIESIMGTPEDGMNKQVHVNTSYLWVRRFHLQAKLPWGQLQSDLD
jgi:hypothetical protein